MNDSEFDLASAVYDACLALGYDAEETEAFIGALVDALDKQRT